MSRLYVDVDGGKFPALGVISWLDTIGNCFRRKFA